ncbi:MAG: mandelate racemase [Rhodoblastus sp.]|nr:mandelate racemase [Rhodoblastus sp.]MCC2112450.1 mandelate racemase [Hyphomicrobiales bacterium]
MSPEVRVDQVSARAFRIPTDAPESDGTLEWNSTTLIVVQASGGRKTGIGYTYASRAAAVVICDTLAPVVCKCDCLDVPGAWRAMIASVRNIGWRGVCANAISAVDWALWDLKAKLVDLPLTALLGRNADSVEIYGSGGFTSYEDVHLAKQLSGWIERDGCRAVKMKVGRCPSRDPARVRCARAAIGEAQLYVDANGALSRKQALDCARTFAEDRVVWFEEPVSSDDLSGLRLVRDRAPDGMEVAAGEYGYERFYFRRMLEAGAVDVLQADATRCCGLTGFLEAAALAEAFSTPLSAHTAPALHVHAGCAVVNFRNVEWFHDHVRIEAMLFDGAPKPSQGRIAPDLSRPGLGLAFKERDAERFAV